MTKQSTKQSDCEKLLGQGQTVFVHFHTRAIGVAIPAYLRMRDDCVLQFGRDIDMVVPIPDMVVSSFGISGTLSFSRSPYHCMVPWDAVTALVGDRTGMYQYHAYEFTGWDKAKPGTDRTVRRPALRLIQGGKK